MSTRSNIALENLDGTIRAIYCHHDGYPEGVGSCLATYYRTEEKINELLDLGNISALDQTLIETIPNAYGSEDERAYSYENRKDYAENNRHGDLEFLYLNVLGVWLVYDIYHNPQWKRLSDVITIEEPEEEEITVTAEQIKRVGEQCSFYSTLHYTANELKRRAADLVEVTNAFEPIRRARDLAPNIDAELDARAAKLSAMRAFFSSVKDLVNRCAEKIDSKEL